MPKFVRSFPSAAHRRIAQANNEHLGGLLVGPAERRPSSFLLSDRTNDQAAASSPVPPKLVGRRPSSSYSLLPSPPTINKGGGGGRRRTSDTTAETLSASDEDDDDDLTSTHGASAGGDGGEGTGNGTARGRQSKRWEERFDELVQYKVLYGTCRVPHRCTDHPGLSRWVVYMRSSRQSGALRKDREAKLTALGFAWGDRGHTTWDQRYDQLTQYLEEHGTTRVACDTPDNQQLWRWCSVQRANYRLGKLLPPRIQALDALGFVWDVDKYEWDVKYDELRDFHQAHGHCRLPNRDPYKKLFLWARVQRSKFDSGALPQERVERLQQLNFGWEKNSMYTSSVTHVRHAKVSKDPVLDLTTGSGDDPTSFQSGTAIPCKEEDAQDNTPAVWKYSATLTDCRPHRAWPSSHHDPGAFPAQQYHCDPPRAATAPMVGHHHQQQQFYRTGSIPGTHGGPQFYPAQHPTRPNSTFPYPTTHSVERLHHGGPPNVSRPRPAEVSTAKKPPPHAGTSSGPTHQGVAVGVRSPLPVAPPDGFDRLLRLAELARQVSPVRVVQV